MLGAGDLPDTPDAMQTGLKGFAGEGRFKQGLVVVTRGELKLGAQSDPVIGVQEPLGQFAVGSLREAGCQKGLGLADQLRLGMARVGKAVDASLAHGFPAVEPVEHPK